MENNWISSYDLNKLFAGRVNPYRRPPKAGRPSRLDRWMKAAADKYDEFYNQSMFTIILDGWQENKDNKLKYKSR